MKLPHEKSINFHSLEAQIMAGFVTRVSAVYSFDGFPIEIPVSNSNCNWLHDKIYQLIR